jgi:predicted transcriptional regulator
MLPLADLYNLSAGGALLSRFSMAVKKRVFTIADEVDHTTPKWKLAQQVVKTRVYQQIGSQLIDYASSQAGNALSEKGEVLTDEEIEAVVQVYLPKVIAVVA